MRINSSSNTSYQNQNQNQKPSFGMAAELHLVSIAKAGDAAAVKTAQKALPLLQGIAAHCPKTNTPEVHILLGGTVKKILGEKDLKFKAVSYFFLSVEEHVANSKYDKRNISGCVPVFVDNPVEAIAAKARELKNRLLNPESAKNSVEAAEPFEPASSNKPKQVVFKFSDITLPFRRLYRLLSQ